MRQPRSIGSFGVVRCYQGLDAGCIERMRRLLSHDLESQLRWKRVTIWPFRRQCVVDIGDNQDAHGQRNLVCSESAKIAAAVELLVMGAGYLAQLAKTGNSLENCVSIEHMLA